MVIAHPDDELFASGLLCELSARGRAFHLACLTRGEGGTAGATEQEGSGRAARGTTGGPPVPPLRSQLGRIRETELRASAAILGASSVTFLDHLDPPGKPHRTYAPEVSAGDLAAQLQPLLQNLQPSLLLTHGSGGEYWHPAHLLVHHAVRRAAGGARDLLTIHAWQEGHPLPGLLNRDDPADLVVKGGPHRAKRLAAFRAHASQHDYFARHGGGSLEAFVDLTAREAYRHYPATIVA